MSNAGFIVLHFWFQLLEYLEDTRLCQDHKRPKFDPALNGKLDRMAVFSLKRTFGEWFSCWLTKCLY